MRCADNVGDNVGDIAGMGADLFGSFAEATCAALVISSVSTIGEYHSYVGMSFPLLISAAGILVCLLTTFIATDLRPARMVSEIENTLKYQLIISTLISTPVRPPSPTIALTRKGGYSPMSVVVVRPPFLVAVVREPLLMRLP